MDEHVNLHVQIHTRAHIKKNIITDMSKTAEEVAQITRRCLHVIKLAKYKYDADIKDAVAELNEHCDVWTVSYKLGHDEYTVAKCSSQEGAQDSLDYFQSMVAREDTPLCVIEKKRQVSLDDIDTIDRYWTSHVAMYHNAHLTPLPNKYRAWPEMKENNAE